MEGSINTCFCSQRPKTLLSSSLCREFFACACSVLISNPWVLLHMHTPETTSESQSTSLKASGTQGSRIASKAALRRIAALFVLIAIALLICHNVMISMPGSSHEGPLAPLTDAQRAASERLRDDVVRLAGGIGQRSTFQPRQFAASAEMIWKQLEQAGLTPREHSRVARGTTVPNIDVTVQGTTLPEEIVLIGAHFDTFQGTPGADDNASGVAAVLELARRFARAPQARTLRFAFFVNEEPPAFWTSDMGSWVYAKKCKADGDRITAMLAIESVGYYSDEPNSQQYPRPLNSLYPNKGNFLAFVSNVDNRKLVRRTISTWRANVAFPSEGAALPSALPGIGWSDHWSFWQEGYPAMMLTDTATFRNPHYHRSSDTPDTLDYERMSRVVDGIEMIVKELAKE
jgi:hypothetical protein